MKLKKLLEDIKKNKLKKTLYRADEGSIEEFGLEDGVENGSYWTSDLEYAKTYLDVSDSRVVYSATVSLSNALYKENINDVTDWNFNIDDLESEYDGIYNIASDGTVLCYVFKNSSIKDVKKMEI